MQTQPDFETIKKLWATSRDLTISDRIANKAGDEVESLLPEQLWYEMNRFAPTSNEFEDAFRNYYAAKSAESKETKTGGKSESEQLDLLPWAAFPGYALDQWARPHGVSGKGRKRGPLNLDKKWVAEKGSAPKFKFGYRPYLDGKQVFRSQRTCSLDRHNAERARRSGEKPWNE